MSDVDDRLVRALLVLMAFVTGLIVGMDLALHIGGQQ